MTAPIDNQEPTLADSTRRPLRLRLRPDLQTVRQTFQGRGCYVIKDPLTLQFYRFEEEEFALLSLVDGRRSPVDIQRAFERQFAPQRLSVRELMSLVSRLHHQSLLVAEVDGQGEQLLHRFREQRQRNWLAGAANLLAIRLPGPNPDRGLSLLVRWTGWIFSWPAVLLMLMLAASAALLVAVEFDTFVRRLPELQQFLATENWWRLALVLSVTKILHELGHGICCKRSGGECHEMGIMFLVGTPCLYCNVSDSWMLSSKWRRAAIGAAGIYVELILAAVATYVWWFTRDGWCHQICLNVMFICSVSTLLFNGNPLLRYDGYFVLSDVIEVPNLKQKSSQLLRRFGALWFRRERPPDDPLAPRRYRLFLLAYGSASLVYRQLILAAILWFLYQACASRGLSNVGRLLVVLVVAPLVLAPLVGLMGRRRTPGRRMNVRPLRVATAGLLLAALCVAGLATPWPYRVRCPARVAPLDARSVYVDVPGVLAEVDVRQGQYVRRGQRLARLRNRSLQQQIAQDEARWRLLQTRLQALQQQAYADPQALARCNETRQQLESLGDLLAQRKQQFQQLTIVAPVSGWVTETLRPAADAPAGQLAYWSGSPLDPENRGAYLSAGVTLCQLRLTSEVQVILDIDEDAIEFVQVGQSVDVVLVQDANRRWQSTISEISRTDAAFGHAAVGDTWSGESPAERIALPPVRAVRSQPSYQARVRLPDTGQAILLSGSAWARVHVGRRSLARRCWDQLQRTFRWEW